MTERTPFLTRGIFSAGHDPLWLNQGTIKGAFLVAAGIAIVAVPSSDDVWRIVVGVLLIAWAVFDLTARIHPRDGARAAPVVQVLVLLAAGVVLLFPLEFDVTLAVGAAVVVRALFDLVRRLRAPRGSDERDRARSAVLLLLFGVLCIIVPETVALGIRAFIGSVAMLVGGIMIAAGLRDRTDDEVFRFDAASAPAMVTNWLRRRQLDDDRAAEIGETLFFEPPRRGSKLASFWVMMALATAIASFAIIQDSTAVVIGAMLVAPLMTPIMGAAAASVNGWLGRLGSSLALAGSAVVVGIGLAWLIAAWLPALGDLSTNAQITSRVQPSLLDLCIAVAAGAAGAYATTDPRVSSSMVGVAVAVALVPPLAVVGITLQAGMYEDALGAFLLFSTNFVSILLVGALVFILTGFAAVPADEAGMRHARRVLGTALIAAVIIFIPLSFTSLQVWSSAADQGTAQDVVDAWLGDVDLRSRVVVKDEVVTVELLGSGSVPSPDDLQQQLDEAFGAPVEMNVFVVPATVVAGTPDAGALEAGGT